MNNEYISNLIELNYYNYGECELLVCVVDYKYSFAA